MSRTYQVISADGHCEAAPDYWHPYVPEKHRARAPRLIDVAEGGVAWQVEGQPLRYLGQHVTGRNKVKFRGESYRNADGSWREGCGPAAQRLREQDLDGIDAEVLYPPSLISVFSSTIADRDAYKSVVSAYNTFLAKDYCSVAPDRLIGTGITPTSGIDDAVDELKRCKELGLTCMNFTQFPNGSGSPKPEDDRYWEAALKNDMRVTPHLRFGGPHNPTQGGNTGLQGFSAALQQRTDSPLLFSISQMIANGVFDRFPELQVYVAETNASWVPSSLFFLDDNYEIFKHWFGVTLKMAPSEYIRKHFLFSFIRDPLAIGLRDFMPKGFVENNLMWGSDFPHSVGSFPDSRQWIEKVFAGAPAELRRRVLVDTPVRYFGLDANKELTPTPGAN
jgi:predicted TIM-barrel fold metal-dependent hydrolase